MPRALLNTFKALDIHLWAKSDTLKWDAPVGVMTDSLRTQLRNHKAELLALLRDKQADACHQGCVSTPSKEEQHKVDSVSEGTDKQLPLNTIILGDCLEKLKTFPDNYFDSIATDSPFGIVFMGKNWDKAIPSISIWKECLRVLKPGGFAFIMSATRQDQLSRMIVNLEDAGFNTNYSSMYWTYASGFPKAHNISKSIDKRLGVVREKTGEIKKHSREAVAAEERTAIGAGSFGDEKTEDLTKAMSPEAKKFDGAYAGFQPKPAVEVIIVAMKPCDKKTYTDQALSNGKGVTWLGDCKIPYKSNDMPKAGNRTATFGKKETISGGDCSGGFVADDKGRFPANLLVLDDVLDDGKKRTQGHWSKTKTTGYGKFGGGKSEYCGVGEKDTPETYSRFFSLDAWAHLNLQDLPKKVQQNLPFIIVPKTSTKEKNAGLDNMQEKKVNDGRKKENHTAFQRGATLRKNTHPTVKPIKLMAYLITMGSRENDIVLDPFAGSATTCIAAKMLNRKYIGIEISPEYHKIAVRRLESIDSDNTIKKLVREAFKEVKEVRSAKNKNSQNQKTLTKAIVCQGVPVKGL